ncbi:SOH1 related regulatory protein [Nitzschia inconspicua]|uniref:Mediator of RNA polymerase II transcription subunit 31 n=1 Tax=Nitzschia inconspicua TaxID=303405 RepID=A0A9K3PSV1_9STRA|nr:SOH1 related regulatory protein [Nitzschia inconspicua]
MMENEDTPAVATTTTRTKEPLPDNRFALELEFVQSLASPAYLHFLASNNITADGVSLLLDAKFKAFLKYLQETWTQPEYSRYVLYPHAFYFLDLLIHNDAFCRELAQVPFRNFCHQQQYFAWQNRFSTLYGIGEDKNEATDSAAIINADKGASATDTAAPVVSAAMTASDPP